MEAVIRAPTGSLLLFSGNRFYSRIIELACHSNWSHVAVIVQGWDSAPTQKALVLESNHSEHNLYDLLTGETRYDGVRLVDAGDLINSRRGEMVVLRTLFTSDGDHVHKSACTLAREMAGRRYERNIPQILGSWYDGPGGETAQDLSTVFCSELAAELYMCAGLIERTQPSSEFTPSDFGVGRCVDCAVARHGSSLSDCIIVQQ